MEILKNILKLIIEFVLISTTSLVVNGTLGALLSTIPNVYGLGLYGIMFGVLIASPIFIIVYYFILKRKILVEQFCDLLSTNTIVCLLFSYLSPLLVPIVFTITFSTSISILLKINNTAVDNFSYKPKSILSLVVIGVICCIIFYYDNVGTMLLLHIFVWYVLGVYMYVRFGLNKNIRDTYINTLRDLKLV